MTDVVSERASTTERAAEKLSSRKPRAKPKPEPKSPPPRPKASGSARALATAAPADPKPATPQKAEGRGSPKPVVRTASDTTLRRASMRAAELGVTLQPRAEKVGRLQGESASPPGADGTRNPKSADELRAANDSATQAPLPVASHAA